MREKPIRLEVSFGLEYSTLSAYLTKISLSTSWMSNSAGALAAPDTAYTSARRLCFCTGKE